jgi:hypothetical protein
MRRSHQKAGTSGDIRGGDSRLDSIDCGPVLNRAPISRRAPLLISERLPFASSLRPPVFQGREHAYPPKA